MSFDVHQKSSQLLESIANSLHDRKAAPTDFTFTVNELQLVERWLLGAIKDALQECGSYQKAANEEGGQHNNKTLTEITIFNKKGAKC